jgi:ribose transport system permease protein
MSAPSKTRATDTSTTPSTGENGSVAGPRPPRRGTVRLADLAEAYALAALTVALLVFFAVLPSSSGTFFTADNLKIVAADQSVLLVVSIAVLFPMVANTWDFTPGAVAGLTSVFAAAAVSSSGSIPLAILVALAAGVGIGIINGILITKTRINSVIATLGMTIVIEGIVQWKTGGKPIVNGVPAALTNFGASSLLGIPKLAWTALILCGLVYWLLSRTVYGRRLYAVGSSSTAAQLVGLRTGRLVFTTYIASGLLAGAAGMLLLCRTGVGNPTSGPSYILPAYAAVFLGSTAVSPGRWNVWGVVIAVLFLGVLNSGLTLAGANPYVNSLVNGLALIGGVATANILARRRGKTLEIS